VTDDPKKSKAADEQYMPPPLSDEGKSLAQDYKRVMDNKVRNDIHAVIAQRLGEKLADPETVTCVKMEAHKRFTTEFYDNRKKLDHEIIIRLTQETCEKYLAIREAIERLKAPLVTYIEEYVLIYREPGEKAFDTGKKYGINHTDIYNRIIQKGFRDGIEIKDIDLQLLFSIAHKAARLIINQINSERNKKLNPNPDDANELWLHEEAYHPENNLFGHEVQYIALLKLGVSFGANKVLGQNTSNKKGHPPVISEEGLAALRQAKFKYPGSEKYANFINRQLEPILNRDHPMTIGQAWLIWGQLRMGKPGEPAGDSGKITQTDIAGWLGICQSAVSQGITKIRRLIRASRAGKDLLDEFRIKTGIKPMNRGKK
jgi:hypothetical protein